MEVYAVMNRVFGNGAASDFRRRIDLSLCIWLTVFESSTSCSGMMSHRRNFVLPTQRLWCFYFRFGKGDLSFHWRLLFVWQLVTLAADVMEGPST
jgi:hypothetical protein